MLETTLVIISAIAYAALWIYSLKTMSERRPIRLNVFFSLLIIALIGHAAWCYNAISTPEGYRFNLYPVISLFLWFVSALVTLSAIKKPIKNLFLVLVPLTLLSFVIGLTLESQEIQTTPMSAAMISHVLLSVIAYGLLTMATLQALFLNYQYKKLKTKHPKGLIGILPPLQTMEKLVFELVGAGFILLSLSILSGLFFIEDMYSQKLTHKTVFSICSWLIYAVIIFGRFRLGWSGRHSIRWLMAGFVGLMLAYFGTKLVLEVILGG